MLMRLLMLSQKLTDQRSPRPRPLPWGPEGAAEQLTKRVFRPDRRAGMRGNRPGRHRSGRLALAPLVPVPLRKPQHQQN